MRNAKTVLGIIQNRGRRGLPLEDVYRQLFNPELFLLAYGKISRNAGAMTPGITAETVDGMSLAKIGRIIDALHRETYRWLPVRRVYIEKKGSMKKRPLGLPTWSDKLLQEAIRLILEAYYEPQFSPASHGFRPSRGCHTALDEVYHCWAGTKWFVEGDIAQCFDTLDHSVLLSILSEKIHDGRFLRLIGNLLQAGYLEDWRYNATLSGCPQGSVLSPILSNIYLDRLDRFVETTLLPKYNCGDRRRPNLASVRMRERAKRLEKSGFRDEANQLRRQMKQVPSLDPMDPAYRRLRYVRYADDWLLGFSGPQCEAEAIKREVGAFLHDELRLELSETKTLITHAQSQAARFLGYDIQVLHNDQKRDRRGHRCLNGQIGLRVPPAVVQDKCKRYLRHGEPIHRTELIHDSVFSIVARYQREYRGVVEYYRRAYNLHQFNRLKWMMERSLTQTLALKLRTSVARVYRRFGAILQTDQGSRVGLEVTVERDAGRRPLTARWGGVTLARHTKAVLDDGIPVRICSLRSDLERRLLANTCELCGSQEDIEVHHVRALKDLQYKGRRPLPLWVQVMAARQRKTLVTCRACHADIHAGRPLRCTLPTILEDTGELGAPNGARPVRGGAVGKVLAMATR